LKTRVLALAAILSLALSATAFAAAKDLTGKVKGDSNSKVTVTVFKDKKGKPLNVVSIKFSNLDYQCDGGAGVFAGEKSGTLKRGGGRYNLNKGTGSDGKKTYFTGGGRTIGGVPYTFDLKVNLKGTKATGAISANFKGPQGTRCELTSGFSAK
jgi:hypothetical protein